MPTEAVAAWLPARLAKCLRQPRVPQAQQAHLKGCQPDRCSSARASVTSSRRQAAASRQRLLMSARRGCGFISVMHERGKNEKT